MPLIKIKLAIERGRDSKLLPYPFHLKNWNNLARSGGKNTNGSFCENI